MHFVLSPRAFILSAIRHVEDTSAIPLAISMFSDVLDHVGVLGDANARHLIIFKHSLVAEVIIKEKGADAMLQVVSINLPIINVVVPRDRHEVLLDLRVEIRVQFRNVLVQEA
jgi:hypothetical protein